MGAPVQLDRLAQVLFHAHTLVIALPQQHLGPGIALLGRLVKPADRLPNISLQIDTLVVEEAQVALSGSILLIGRLPVQLSRPALVLFHTAAHLITEAKLTDGRKIPLLGGGGKKLRRPRRVLRSPDPADIAQAQVVLGGNIAPLRRLGKPEKGLLLVLGRTFFSFAVVQPQTVFRLQVPVLRGGYQFLKAFLLLRRYPSQTLHDLRVYIYHDGVLRMEELPLISFFRHWSRSFLTLHI